MLLNYILLSLCVSIDSLGIGITYGVRNTRISFISKFILFIISILLTSISVFLGNSLSLFLTDNITKIIGFLILEGMGIWIIAQALKDNLSFDLDNSQNIDFKEAIFLGIALSLDSIGIGIGSGAFGLSFIIFPILVASFQFIFLSTGKLLGIYIKNISNIPNNIWNIIAGILVIIIGFGKFFI